jgi:hypothetical protein
VYSRRFSGKRFFRQECRVDGKVVHVAHAQRPAERGATDDLLRGAAGVREGEG